MSHPENSGWLMFCTNASRFGNPKTNLRRFAANFFFEGPERASLLRKLALSGPSKKKFRAVGAFILQITDSYL